MIGSDVPDGALAGSPGVSRSAQRNVEGYASTRRQRAEAEGAGAPESGDAPAAGPAAALDDAAASGSTGEGAAAPPEPKPPDPELEQIREWVGQGRTDAWIAYRLGVSAQRVHERKLEAGVDQAPESGRLERG